MKKYLAYSILIASFLLFAQPGFAQLSQDIKALDKDVKELKEQQKTIQKDIEEIKTLLKARQQAPAPPAEFKEALINVDDNPFKGDSKAKLALIEFSDYQ